MSDLHLRPQEVGFDPKLFPRQETDMLVVSRYADALEAGATFPPIVVGKKGSKYVLIDGAHRLLAHKAKERETIAATETAVPEKDWYMEAVRLNAAHGSGLKDQERQTAISRLHRAGYLPSQISRVVAVSMPAVERLIAGLARRPDAVKVARGPVSCGGCTTRRVVRNGNEEIEATCVVLAPASERLDIAELTRDELVAWSRRAEMVSDMLKAALKRRTVEGRLRA